MILHTCVVKSNQSKNKSTQVVIALSAATLLIFEQSPLNEALRAFLGFEVLKLTANPLLVGLAVTAATFIIEITSSSLIAFGISKSKRFKQFISKFGFKKAADTTKNTASDYALALGIGAGMLVIKKHFKNPTQKLKVDLRNAFKATVVISLFSGFVGFLAGGGVELARQYGFGDQAQFFLNVVTDWRFWLVVVIVSQTGDIIRWRSATRA